MEEDWKLLAQELEQNVEGKTGPNTTTLISHIYNEEYLLPFWLNHHKDLFDNIIIIDYASTDSSIDICKRICPNCIILQSANSNFAALEVDREVMQLEHVIKGIKMILNTTEYFFSEQPIKTHFLDKGNSTLFMANVISPYSKKEYNIISSDEIFSNLLNSDITFHCDRFHRILHNNVTGRYKIGRHGTYNNNIIYSNEIFVVWLGFYPLNENLLKRKLQIKNRMPENDKKHIPHHMYEKDKMLEVINDKSNTGHSLEYICPNLYNLINNRYKLGLPSCPRAAPPDGICPVWTIT